MKTTIVADYINSTEEDSRVRRKLAKASKRFRQVKNEDFAHAENDLKHAQDDLAEVVSAFKHLIKDFEHAIDDFSKADRNPAHAREDHNHAGEDFDSAEEKLQHALKDFRHAHLGDSISDWEENEVKQTVEMAFFFGQNRQFYAGSSLEELVRAFRRVDAVRELSHLAGSISPSILHHLLPVQMPNIPL